MLEVFTLSRSCCLLLSCKDRLYTWHGSVLGAQAVGRGSPVSMLWTHCSAKSKTESRSLKLSPPHTSCCFVYLQSLLGRAPWDVLVPFSKCSSWRKSSLFVTRLGGFLLYLKHISIIILAIMHSNAIIFCSCLFFKIGFLGARNRVVYNWTPVPSKMPRKRLNISTLVTEVLRSSDPRPSLYLSLFYHFAFTAHPGSRFLSFFSQMSAMTSLLTTEIPPLSPPSVFST